MKNMQMRNNSISAEPSMDSRSKANLEGLPGTDDRRHASAMKSKYTTIDPYNDVNLDHTVPNHVYRQNRLLDNGNGGYAASKRHYYDSPTGSDSLAYKVMRNEQEN